MSIPPIQFLFRFRDLVAKTIYEHHNLIEKEKQCWWGWWKRPTEGNRQDVWGPLQKDARPGSPQPVGLFDSGSGNVYIAYVTEVIPPGADSSTLVPVPNGEEYLIPEYYRTSPFSRAWMKLIKVDPNPIDFFEHYSFAEAPPLKNYAPEVLNRFHGKVIKSPEELRGMDTTIWRIQPRDGKDRDEEILLTTRFFSEAISIESRDLAGC